MEKIIQFLVATQNDAYNIVNILKKLNGTDAISIAGIHVLGKNASEKISLKNHKENNDDSAVLRAFADKLMGFISAPAGSHTYGTLLGAIGDMTNMDTRQVYLDKIAEELPLNQLIVLAHVYEEWEAPINSLAGAYAEIKRISVDAEIDGILQNDIQEFNKRVVSLGA